MSNKIRLLPDNWTYADYFAFVHAFQSGDSRETFRLAQQLVISWDYDVDLNQDHAIMKLGVYESAEVIRTVMQTIAEYLETLDVSPVTVNFAKWDTERFLLYDDYRRTKKFAQAEAMLPEVIQWPGYLPEVVEAPLSFTVAATAFKAINVAYTKVVTGKN